MVIYREIDEELLTDPEDKRSWDDSGVDVAIQVTWGPHSG